MIDLLDMGGGLVLPPEPVLRVAPEAARSVPRGPFGLGYCGIDPGLSGYFAVLAADGRAVLRQATAPAFLNGEGHPDRYDLAGMFALCRDLASLVSLVIIEKQQAYPDQGAVSNYTTGYGYGLWCMALTAAGVPFEELAPITWKKLMGIQAEPSPVGSEDPKKRRARMRKEALARAVAKAQSLFPGYDLRATERSRVPSPDKATALLLATVARRKHLGNTD